MKLPPSVKREWAECICCHKTAIATSYYLPVSDVTIWICVECEIKIREKFFKT